MTYLKDSFICFENHISFISCNTNPQKHTHFAKHILLSKDSFTCIINNSTVESCGIIIQSNVTHARINNNHNKVFIILIDETSDLSKEIDSLYLKNNDVVNIPSQIIKDSAPYLIENNLQSLDTFVLDSLINPTIIYSKKDDRIENALSKIEASECLDSDFFKQLIDNACISQSRFSHLFKEQANISFKSYILLKRIEKVYQYVIIQKLSITDAALRAGFSSSTHFATACKDHYGISISEFIKAQNLKY